MLTVPREQMETTLDQAEYLVNKIRHMCRKYASTAIRSNLNDVPSCKDVDRLLNYIILLETGQKMFTKRPSVNNLYEPAQMFMASFCYWSRVLRKVHFLQEKCGGCQDIGEAVTLLLKLLQKDLAMVCSGKFLCCQRKRKYRESVYYPRKYLIEP